MIPGTDGKCGLCGIGKGEYMVTYFHSMHTDVCGMCYYLAENGVKPDVIVRHRDAANIAMNIEMRAYFDELPVTRRVAMEIFRQFQRR